jgi:WD40 repeat protein
MSQNIMSTRVYIALLLCLFTVCLDKVQAQLIRLDGIDNRAFPRMKAQFSVFDPSGNRVVNRGLQDVRIIERQNIERRVLSVQCPPAANLPLISAAISIDVSGSMTRGEFAIPPEALARYTAKELLQILPLPPSEIALQTCNNIPFVVRDFTQDKAALNAAIDKVVAGGDNNFAEHLLNFKAGLLRVAAGGKYKKVAILCTDAWWPALSTAELEQCRQLCSSKEITFYALVYSKLNSEPDGIIKSLKQLAASTGGVVIDGITTLEQASISALTLQSYLSGTGSCTVEWLSDRQCADNSMMDISITDIPFQVKDTATYQVPDIYLNELQVNPPFIAFGGRPSLGIYDTTITITARGADYTITGITRRAGTAEYNVNATVFPFVLSRDSSFTFTVRYAPLDSTTSYAYFEVQNNVCPALFSVGGGFLDKPIRDRTLKLLFPNGGEKLIAGSDTIITWTGISPKDTVALEYSLDGGKTWYNAARTAWGNKANWTVDRRTSPYCLMRVRQLQLESGFGSVSSVLTGHKSRVISTAWNKEASLCFTGGADSTLRIWDMRTGRQIQVFRFKAPVNALTMNPDWSLMAIAADSCHILNVQSRTIVQKFSNVQKNADNALWSKDGKSLLIYNSGSFIAYNVADARQLIFVAGFFDGLNHAEWSPDGTRIVSAQVDTSVCIWDVQTGFLVKRLNLKRPAAFARWSPAGNVIAVVNQNEDTCRLWNPNTDNVIKFSGQGRPVISLEWNAAGNLLATGGGDGQVFVLRTDGTAISQCRGHEYPVRKIKWSPSDNEIATVSDDNTCRLWNIYNGSLIRKMEGHTGAVLSLAWNQQGTRIITGSADSTARTWIVDKPAQQTDTSDAEWEIIAPSPAALNVDMGTITTGQQRDSVILGFINNKGTYKFRVDSILIIGADAVHFRQISGFPPYIVEPGRKAPAEFRFIPQSPGRKTATLLIYTQNDTLRQTITGNAIQAQLAVQNGFVDFDTVALTNNKDTLVKAIIKNLGSTDIQLNKFTFDAAAINQFSFSTGIADTSFILQAGKTCELLLRFTPKTEGRISGLLNVNYQGGIQPLSIQLFGVGIAPFLSVKDVDFGPVAVNQQKDTIIQAWLQNPLPVPALIKNCEFIGSDSLAFSFSGGSRDTSLIIPANTNLAFSLRFSPKQKGLAQAKLQVNYQNQKNPLFSTLTGIGISSGISFIAKALPVEMICTDSIMDSVIIANTGMAPVRFSRIWIDGPDSGNFILSSAPSSLQPGSTDYIYYTVKSALPGTKTAFLNIQSNSDEEPLLRVSLSAIKQVSALAYDKVSLDLGNLCPDEAAYTDLSISNPGSITTVYQIRSKFLNIGDSVSPGNRKSYRYSFPGNPLPGLFLDTLQIENRICNTVFKIPVNARIQAPDLTIPDLTILAEAGGFSGQGVLAIINKGMMPATISVAEIPPPFFLADPFIPQIIRPFDTLFLGIVFQATDTIKVMRNARILVDECAKEFPFTITGIPTQYAGFIKIGNYSAKAGQSITVPIEWTAKEDLSNAGIQGIQLDITYNASLLEPVNPTPTGRISGNQRTISITADFSKAARMQSNELTKLNFIAALGNDSLTGLLISKVQTIGGKAFIGIQNGSFTLLDLCYQGGARLFNNSGKFALNVLYSKTANSIVRMNLIENGYTSLELYDLIGNKVVDLYSGAALPGEYSIPLPTIPTGLYILQLRTPANSIHILYNSFIKE